MLYTIFIFCICSIFAVNKDLLFLLWEKVKHWHSEQCIAKIFIDMVSVLIDCTVLARNVSKIVEVTAKECLLSMFRKKDSRFMQCIARILTDLILC